MLVVSFYVGGDAANRIACAIFVLAGVTDFLDGYAARRFDQRSALGRFLDPVADKLLIASAHPDAGRRSATDQPALTTLAALVILCREILVSGLREFLAEVRCQRSGKQSGQMEDHPADGRA